MSELRNQLRTLRDRYQRLRYPGNLAADVLGSPAGRPRAARPMMRVAGAVAATLLLAAAVAVLLVPGSAWFAVEPTGPAVVAGPAGEAHTLPVDASHATLWNTFSNTPSLISFASADAREDDNAAGSIDTPDAAEVAMVPSFPSLEALIEEDATLALSEDSQ